MPTQKELDVKMLTNPLFKIGNIEAYPTFNHFESVKFDISLSEGDSDFEGELLVHVALVAIEEMEEVSNLLADLISDAGGTYVYWESGMMDKPFDIQKVNPFTHEFGNVRIVVFIRDLHAGEIYQVQKAVDPQSNDFEKQIERFEQVAQNNSLPNLLTLFPNPGDQPLQHNEMI